MKHENIKMYGSAIINTLRILPANTRWQDTCQAGWGWWTDISISRVKICLQFQNRPSLYKTHCLVAFFSILDWSEPSSRSWSPGVFPQTEPCIDWITQTNKSVQSACKPACMHPSAAFIVKFSKLLLIQVKYFPFTILITQQFTIVVLFLTDTYCQARGSAPSLIWEVGWRSEQRMENLLI